MKQWLSQIFSNSHKIFWAVVLGLLAGPTFATPGGSAPTDVKSLAASVNFADVITAILSIAGSVIAIYVSWKGAQFVIRQVRGA